MNEARKQIIRKVKTELKITPNNTIDSTRRKVQDTCGDDHFMQLTATGILQPFSSWAIPVTSLTTWRRK